MKTLRNLYLSLGIGLNHAAFAELDLSHRYYLHEIAQLADLPFSPFPQMPLTLLRFLQLNPEDVLVAEGINKAIDYKNLAESLPDDTRIALIAANLKSPNFSKYDTAYAKHSNWLYYSPEAVRQITADHHAGLRQILKLAELDGVKTITVQ